MADSVEAAEIAELVELREPNLSEERQEETRLHLLGMMGIHTIPPQGTRNPHFCQKNTLISQENFKIFGDF